MFCIKFAKLRGQIVPCQQQSLASYLCSYSDLFLLEGADLTDSSRR